MKQLISLVLCFPLLGCATTLAQEVQNVDKQPHIVPVTAEGVYGVPKAAKTPTSHNWFRRHPKATALIVGAAVGTVVGIKLGYKKPCASSYNGVAYNGGPICPSYCDSLGHCDWPETKK